MWFRQVQLFQLTNSFRLSTEMLLKRLETFPFSPCMPSMPSSLGWVAPTGEAEGRLFRMINDCVMLCLEVEEKILPASVIKQFLQEKIQKIEAEENRKVYNKEKETLKDELTITLLPRAFGKRLRIYGYVDLKKQWLFVGSTTSKRVEQFIGFFKKTFSDGVTPYRIEGLSEQMTHWIQNGCHSPFSVGEACLMQDKATEGRMIRCRQQDLFQEGIQALLKTGCSVKELALAWHDQLTFVLLDTFALQSIRFEEEVIARSRELSPETKDQQFDADFFIFSSLFAKLFEDLLRVLPQAATPIIEPTVA